MLEVRCEDLGIHCRGKLRARTEGELIDLVASHAGEAHGVPRLNETLVGYALSKARGRDEASEEVS